MAGSSHHTNSEDVKRMILLRLKKLKESASTPHPWSKPGTPENARAYVDKLITNDITKAITACDPFDDVKILQALEDISTQLEKLVSKLASEEFTSVRKYIFERKHDIGYCKEHVHLYMIFKNEENSHTPHTSLRSLLVRLHSDI